MAQLLDNSLTQVRERKKVSNYALSDAHVCTVNKPGCAHAFEIKKRNRDCDGT